MNPLVILARVAKRVFMWLRLLVLFVLILLVLRHSTIPLGDPYYALAFKVKDDHFDYVGWELGAIRAKLAQTFSGTHGYLVEQVRSDFVRTYVGDLDTVRRLEADIERIFTDPAIADPDAETLSLREERDRLRADLLARQSVVESILEGQVAAVLVDEGFGIGGQLFPPLAMRFTQRVQLLVASPRDKIDMAHVMTVEPIPVDRRDEIEQQIFNEQNLSAVIVPIGGMALYPAMVVESTNLSYITDTFAHEWFHHYLMFHPLGWETEIFQNSEARIINETTASVFGREIGRKVLERYYPDLVPPPPPPVTEPPPQTEPPPIPDPPPFDYNAAMHETRTTVDEMLAEGKIEEAEAYMEERRALFVENGYGIRKLNQAWFSFYGGYQVEGISAGGEDPIGPAVQSLREESDSLYDWVQVMKHITTREQLLSARDAVLASGS